MQPRAVMNDFSNHLPKMFHFLSAPCLFSTAPRPSISSPSTFFFLFAERHSWSAGDLLKHVNNGGHLSPSALITAQFLFPYLWRIQSSRQQALCVSKGGGWRRRWRRRRCALGGGIAVQPVLVCTYMPLLHTDSLRQHCSERWGRWWEGSWGWIKGWRGKGDGDLFFGHFLEVSVRTFAWRDGSERGIKRTETDS